MKEAAKNSAIRAYEIMKKKDYSPEEIETFLAFLNQNAIDVAQPLVQPLVQRMDQLEERFNKLEMWFKYGFGTLAVAILVAPGLVQDIVKSIFSL